MIQEYLQRSFTAAAPALANHIWQSTLFALAAGLLTLTLRKNRARARYSLWLAASLKFLIPFSLLVAVGSQLAWTRAATGPQAGLYFTMQEVSQPFTTATIPAISAPITRTVSSSPMHALPSFLAAIWLCGFIAVLFVWYRRWRQISAAIRQATPLHQGRELNALRQLERSSGAPQNIEMRLSDSSLEPGIFGIARPVLVWPQGISDRLDDSHLHAILAHELTHVRRRDNLAATIHMLVEAIFWFYPLVWWLGARLVEERERACDEQVLESGAESKTYAESILQICKFCVGSPLTCVSGVTGADLKKRIQRIMAGRVARELDLGKKLLLAAAGVLAIALPVALGVSNATPGRAQSQDAAPTAPAYESGSITPSQTGAGPANARMMFGPGTFMASGVPLQAIIKEAYGIQDYQISGAPDWLNSDKYDFEAKAPGAFMSRENKVSPEQMKLQNQRMLQAFLADRLKLVVHQETKDLNVYSLVVAEGGAKLQPSASDAQPHATQNSMGVAGAGPHSMMSFSNGELGGRGVAMKALTEILARQLNTVVLDKTGLTGSYDFTLRWTPVNASPEGAAPIAAQENAGAASSDSAVESIRNAVQEQLGLKLEPQIAPVATYVIDHVEKPARE